MRIIGGKYRGRKLISPDSEKVRPTSDRAREALFNILRSRLGNDWSTFALLDVFAGSGAFGLEALSHGVKEVALVDVDTRPLLKNIQLFDEEKARIRVIKSDALKLGAAPHSYDILFMDAPYQKGLSEPVLQNLAANHWLKPGALCLVEVERNEVCHLPEDYEFLDERFYGAAKIIIAVFQPQNGG